MENNKHHYDAIDIRFGELLLKGRNMGKFTGILCSNITKALSKQEYARLERLRDRFIIHLSNASNIQKIIFILSKIPGVSIISPVYITKPHIKSILQCSAKFSSNKNIKIIASRSFKGHKITSVQIISAFIKSQEELSFKIDKNARHSLYINLTKEHALLSSDRLKGPGGLPIGSSGGAISLLSGGIDSPVSTYQCMIRGIRPVYLHFHAFKDSTDSRLSKIRSVVKILSSHCGSSDIYFVPTHIFIAHTINTPKRYELVLFKRFMYKISEYLCDKHNLLAIITGESVGQVASQTIPNMLASQAGIQKLILRPLIGTGKDKIIDMAKEIGTFDTSIIPYVEVCSMKIPDPGTNIPVHIIDKLYQSTKMDECVEKTIQQITKEYVLPG